METLRIADRYRPKVERLVLAALRTMADVPDGWADLLRAGDLEAALARIDRSGLHALAPRFVSKAKSPDGDDLDDLLGNAAIESAASPPATLGLDATFEIVNARAIQWAQDRAAQLVVQVDNETRRAIRDVVARVITEGGGTRAIARDVRLLVGLTTAQARSLARYADTVAEKKTASKLVTRRADRLLRYRAKNIARTETMRAANVGLRLQWDDLASRGLIDRKYAVRVWQVTPDDRLCDLCAPMAGQTVGYDAPFIATERGVKADERQQLPSPLSTTEPPLHPQCLPGDTLVLARNGISGLVSRPYEGPVAVIRTADGHQLTCTPNHPVLTSAGWVAAGRLDVGGDVVTDPGFDRLLLDEEHEYRPSMIEEVAEAFGRTRGVTSRPVPVAAEDFHGDGHGSEIAVVRSHLLLRDGPDPTLGEHPGERGLALCRSCAVLAGARGGDPPFERDDTPADRVVRGSGLRAALLGGHRLPLDPLGLAPASDRETEFPQPEVDHVPAHAEHLRDPVHGLPAGVTLSQIIEVKIETFHGDVFNMETPYGHYTANGIVVHNCRCTMGLDYRFG